MRPGDKVRMTGERQRYTVTAVDDRFAIMSKPFNARRTYLYTITDLKLGVRGPCDLIFGVPCAMDAPDSAAKALTMLQAGEMGVSRRRCKALTDDEIVQLKS